MAGPWEKYGAAPKQEQGPWGKYGGSRAAPPASEPAPPDPNERFFSGPIGGSTISAVQQPKSMGEAIEQSYAGIIDDLKYGTDKTVVGKMLRKAGAPALYSGTSQGAADIMGSPVTGIARVGQGLGQVAQDNKKVQGTKNIVGGALEAATIPSMVVVPESAPSAAAKAVGAIPSATRAGQTFKEVASVANNVPVGVSQKLGDIVLEAKSMQDAGSNMPQVIRKFYNRITDPQKGALTYEEARRFYQNATRMSAQETLNTNKPMQRQLAMFTNELKNVIYEAAEKVGKREDLQSAMAEFAAASRNADRMEVMKDAFKTYLKYAIPGTAAAYTAKKIWDGGR